MKKLLALSTVVMLVMLVVSSCSVSVALNIIARVSGTLTFNNMSVPSPASVTLQQGSTAYGASVSIPAGQRQVGSFSISNVPGGTYSFVATFSSPWNTYTSAYYIINGGFAVPLTVYASYNYTYHDYDWVAQINGVSIQGDGTIDIYIAY